MHGQRLAVLAHEFQSRALKLGGLDHVALLINVGLAINRNDRGPAVDHALLVAGLDDPGGDLAIGGTSEPSGTVRSPSSRSHGLPTGGDRRLAPTLAGADAKLGQRSVRQPNRAACLARVELSVIWCCCWHWRPRCEQAE